jgi:HAD superfamily hydrolase (TIGR01509 family)
MTPSPPPILLLDVMSTLVTEPFEVDSPAFFGVPMAELLRVKDPTAWVEFEHGRIDEREYAARFFADRRPLDLEAFKAMMRRSYRWMDGVEPLLAELKAGGHAMYALSNYSAWWTMIEEELGLSRYLDWRFVSARTGLRKPDPAAYLGAAEALGVAPGRCLFVDDRRGNVEAARRVGMQAVLRRPRIEDLRADLAAAGLGVHPS